MEPESKGGRMADERRSVSISGSGRMSGGTYTGVSISGSGRIEGDVICDTLRISGSGKVDGSLETKEARISGAGKVSGDTEAGQITVSGSGTFGSDVTSEEFRSSGVTRVDGSLRAKEAKSSGTLRVTESMSSEYVKTSGILRVGADLEAEIFKSTGVFDVHGLLNADRVEVQLAGYCKAREIGCEKIEVRLYAHRGAFLEGLARALLGQRGTARLEAQLIEGDEIYLEHTTAEVVRGKRVNIGPGCRIRSVEYTDSIEVDDEAEVGSQSKT